MANKVSPRIKLAPSILSADFARLGEQVAEATKAGADYIHIDVMDGRFVPTITIGPLVVAAIRKWTDLPLDVHLMVEDPERHIEAFAQAGANIITVHVEVCPHLHRAIHTMKQLKIGAGVAINPGTALHNIEQVLASLDMVLLMTVNPGAAGQPFIPEMVDKIALMRHILDNRGLKAELEVDGGLNSQLAPVVVKAGANVLVAGSAVFNKKETVAQAIARLRASVEQAGS